MKRFLTALVLIPLVLALVFIGPDWLVALFSALVAMLAAWEYLGIARAVDSRPPRVPVLVAVGLLFAVWMLRPDRMVDAVGALAMLLFVVCAFACPIERVLRDSSTAVFALIYTGLTLVSLPALRSAEDGRWLLSFLFCAVWAGDIVALYVGRNLGKRKLARSLSPNKTWEGAIGSIVGSLLSVGGLIALSLALQKREVMLLAYQRPAWYWLALAVLVNVAAQVGDLAESGLKRSAGVKDSGTLLPGHGGILDRIDALLLAAPVLWYAQVVQHF